MRGFGIRSLHLVLLGSVILSLTGCMFAGLALQGGMYAATLTSQAFSAMEVEDVKMALGPDVKPGDLKKIRKIALLFEQSPEPQVAGMGVYSMAGLERAFSDNLAIELMRLDMEVVDQQQFRAAAVTAEGKTSVESEPPQSMSASALAAAATTLEVDAIARGSVSGSHATTASMFSGASTKQVVSNATVKLLSPEDSSLLLAMAVTYKKGQSADDASKALAKLLKAKLENPEAEIGEDDS